MANKIKWLRWDSTANTIKKFIDLTMNNLKEELEWLALRDFKVIERYHFYDNCIISAIDQLDNSLINIKTIPQFCNVEPTEEEKAIWKDDSEVCTFEGIWDFFGYRIPVYLDDYGQQNYIKFYNKKREKLEEISNGCYCVYPDNCAHQVLYLIKYDIESKIKDLFKEKTNFNIDELLEREAKGEFNYGKNG